MEKGCLPKVEDFGAQEHLQAAIERLLIQAVFWMAYQCKQSVGSFIT